MRWLQTAILAVALFAGAAIGTGAQGFRVDGRNVLDRLRLVPVAQSTLGNEAGGTIRYCQDCAATNPCSAGGTGAIATRLGGTWACSTGAADSATDFGVITPPQNEPVAPEVSPRWWVYCSGPASLTKCSLNINLAGNVLELASGTWELQ